MIMCLVLPGTITPYGHQLNTEVNASSKFLPFEMKQCRIYNRLEVRKATVFAEYLSKEFTPLNNETTDEIEVQLTNLPSNIPKIELSTTKEVKKRNKLSKSTESTGIRWNYAKNVKKITKKRHSINSILRESH